MSDSGPAALKTHSPLEELKISELRYRRLFETAQDGILLIDFETGMILDANQFLIDLLDYSKADFLKKHLWEVGVFKDIVASKENFVTLQKKKYVRFEDLPLQTKAGKHIDVEFVANAYQVDGATIIQCNIRDITERKKAEIALQESEIKFRQLFDNMSSGVVIYEARNDGQDFIIKNFNKAAESIEKIKKESVIGKSVLTVFPSIREFGLFEVFQKVWRTGKPMHHPVKLYKDSRVNGWRENYIYKLPNSDIVAVYDDVTEQKKAEYLLSVSELRYRRLFETAQDGILLIDFETGMILDANQFLIDLLDYSKADFLKKHLWEVGVFKDIVASKENFVTLQKKKYVRFEDLPLQTKTGKHVDVEFVANAYQVDGATIIQCNIRDITDRKKAEYIAQVSELKYRRLFETAQDGILLIDFETGMILDVNQFLIDLLDYSKADFLKKHLWDVGIFKDIVASKENFKTLQEKRFVRFEDLPLQTKTGKHVDVEFVANAYQVDGATIIQCNIRDITDRKKAEYIAQVTLRQSEEKFSKAFQTSPYAITITRARDGSFQDVNDAFSSISGYTREEALTNSSIGLKLWVNEKDRAHVMADLQAGRTVVGHEYFFRMKSGIIFSGLFSALLIQLSGEQCVLSSIADISERRRAEDAIQKNEVYLRATLESTDDGILAIDDHGKILHSNTRFVEFWKIPKNLLDKKDDNVLLTYVLDQLTDPKGFLKKVKALYKSMETSFDTILFKDGRIFERYSTPLLIDKKIRGRVWSFRDVTQRMKNEQEIMEAKAKSESILASIGDGVFACDTKGTIVLFNKVAEDMTGIPAREAIGTLYTKTISFIRESTGKPSTDFIAEAIRNEKITKMANHVLLVRRDGRTIPVADSAAPIKDANGKTIGCVVVFHDVTKERQIDKAKTEFVSLASHQLRTPLTTINWFSEMLLSEDVGKMTPKQRQYTEDVYHASQRMVSLINALLNVSRLELGTFAVEPETVNMIKIAKTCLEDLQPMIVKKHLKVEELFDSQLTAIKADPKLLSMVFQNLFSNSIKYSKDGGIIRFAVRRDKEQVVISVADTGIGIPLEQQKNIFGKLYRADNAKKIDPDGAGLGLYIVKEILDHSGGRVWFESIEGKGSTFYASLPLSGMQKQKGVKKLI